MTTQGDTAAVTTEDRALAIWNQWRGYDLTDDLRTPFIEFAAKVMRFEEAAAERRGAERAREIPFSKGANAIAAERMRQLEVEGWTPEHDAVHSTGELVSAAVSYLLAEYDDRGSREYWPWDWEWYKPKDKRANLIRAGALIAAELDRAAQAGGE